MIVRPIKSSELDAVYRLTHDAYVEKGYIEPRPDGRLIHYPHLDGIAETTVLIAIKDGEIVGTNSITEDSSAGLHCERDFPTQIMRERLCGYTLCCSWRIVTRCDVRDNFSVLYAIIRETAAEFIRQKMRICMMTFHPSDALVYMKLLNAQVIGFSECTTGLRNAPALLLRSDIHAFPMRLRKELEIAE